MRASELLTSNFPGISVEPYFVKFDGIWEVRNAGGLKSAAPAKRKDAREIA
jgi:hypothetical protein